MSADGEGRDTLAEYTDWREKQAVIDAEKLANIITGLDRMRGCVRREDVLRVNAAIQHLSHTGLPDSYVQGIRIELMQMLGAEHMDRTFVYLTFWGVDDRADFLKVGVAKDVNARMAALKTGNPLNRLWTFKMAFTDRQEAMRVETKLLTTMVADRASGEWVKVARCTAQASKAIADDLAALAVELVGRPTELLVEG